MEERAVTGHSELEEDQEEDAVTHEPATLSVEDLAAIRALALRAYPETVPELVAGSDLASLLGSLEPAQEAYRRIADGVAAQTPPPVPTVPAGSAPPVAIDPEQLPPVEKIRRALANR